MKIKDSVILVTGAASGIGEDIARYFAANGAIVYICDIQKEKGQLMETESKGKIRFILCDVSEDSQVKQMINTIFDEQKRIDIVINNAGITGTMDPLEKEISEVVQNFIKNIKVNLVAAFLVSKYSAQKMIQNYDKSKECNGVIIHISSIMGLQGIKGATSYAAAKAGLIGMTLPMARDLGKFKIRVNSICPGLIETPLSKAALSASFKSIAYFTPIKRLGLPFEVTQTCEAIIVNDFMNGSVIKVDGGLIGQF